MRSIESADELYRLVTDRPAHTHTYRADAGLIEQLPQEDGAPELRIMDKREVRELASYLGVDDAADLDGPLRVVDAACHGCDRRLTMLDFVKTAAAAGAHPAEHLRDVLLGRAGAWITIRGLDGGRPVQCATCERTALRSDYSEYSSSSYAYA